MAASEDPQARVQQLAVTAEQLRQETDILQQQIALLQTTLQQLRGAEDGLDELQRRGDNASSVLIPIGGGFFVRGQIPATKEVLTSIGSGTYRLFPLEKGLERAKSQVETLEAQLVRLDQQLSEKMAHLNSINREIESIIVQAQAEQK
ncbi:MAG: prefoldin subunit alpha [Candidatus Thorarchaeota archaeon]